MNSHNAREHEQSETANPDHLGRRKLIKALGAGGTLLAVNTLTLKWQAPFVELGQLASAGTTTTYSGKKGFDKNYVDATEKKLSDAGGNGETRTVFLPNDEDSVILDGGKLTETINFMADGSYKIGDRLPEAPIFVDVSFDADTFGIDDPTLYVVPGDDFTLIRPSPGSYERHLDAAKYGLRDGETTMIEVADDQGVRYQVELLASNYYKSVKDDNDPNSGLPIKESNHVSVQKFIKITPN